MKYIIYLIIFTSYHAGAQVSKTDIQVLIQGGIQNILNLQVQNDEGEVKWKGEWPSVMMNTKYVLTLGPKGKFAVDSNCFTTALVHNELAKYSLRNNQLTNAISVSLQMALENIQTFRSETGTFNFWHKLPMTEAIQKKTSETYKNLLVHRPNQYELKSKFAAVRSNIADDADDTAVAYTAIGLNEKLNLKYRNNLKKSDWQPTSSIEVFEKYRDQNRNENLVNKLKNTPKNTGAYLTWLTEQNSTFLGSIFKGWKQNLRIPEGSNNVDCVVNANVLQMLTLFNKQNSESAKAACQFIEKSIDNGLSKKCGYYYPNPYNLHFAVSSAFESGVSCLKTSAQKLFKNLIDEQNENGSWGWVKKTNSLKKNIINEPVGASVYAANALFIFANELNLSSEYRSQLDSAAKFIITTAKLKKDNTYTWEPGIFFSGGSFVRRLVIWKSEAYTSVLAVQALDRYSHLIIDQKSLLKSEP